ncbi:MAG: 16S rRNA (cytosine(1402)-N(4))-methyltransferase, partial [Candidatus Hinthialibacter sp.]
MNPDPEFHIPVMEAETAEFLRSDRSGVVLVDATIGYGGHSAVLTQSFGSADRLIGIDRDAQAIAYCQKKFAGAPFQVSLHQRGFEELDEILNEEGIS